MRQIALWLSWLLLFVVPWEYMVESGALGTLVRVTGIVLAGVWALSALVRARLRHPHALHASMLGFALWAGASVLWSLDPEASRGQAGTYLQLVLLAVIVWDLYEKPSHLAGALQAYVLGAWVCIALLLQTFLSGDVQRRFSIGLFNENTLGFTLALGIPIAWRLSLTVRELADGLGERWASLLRIANLAFIPAALFGISLTASRSAMASAFCGLGYMALSIGGLRGGVRILLFGAAAAVAVWGVSLIPTESVERLETTTVELSEGDWNGRLPIWNEALRMISERPLHGVGVSAFQVGAVETRAAPHNFVLGITAELGVIGFALYASILVGCGLLALRQPAGLSIFWLAMLGSWLLSALAHNFEDKKMTWLLFGLIAVSDGLYRIAPAAESARNLRSVTAAGRAG